MKRIAIFGGSFDPVHQGHMELAAAAREIVDIDKVIFMPCWQSPFKGRTIATARQRFEMLEIAIQENELSGWAEVSDYEISRPERSYSWQTVEYFQNAEEQAATEWWWILGTDQWQQIEKWAEPGKLRTQLRFVVMTRDGDEVQSKGGWEHKAVSFVHPASSSAIRRDFDLNNHWLPAEVKAYCETHSIY